MSFKVGRLVKFFVLADLTVFGAWGFIEPIFSIFIIEHVVGATLETVGIAAAIFWITRALIQPPVANYLDKKENETSDFHIVLLGLVLAAVSAFAFTWVSVVWELYAVQFIHAVGFALYIAAWSGIFGRHLDKKRVSFDWSLDSAGVAFASGVSALLGGFAAAWLGFNIVFIFVGVFSLLSALLLFVTPELVIPLPIVPRPVAQGTSQVAEAIHGK